MKVFCIGNPAIPEDRLAWELADELKIEGVDMITCGSPEELFGHGENPLVIMDVARGIDEVKVMDDLSKIRTGRMISLHDFDLATFLKLMEGMGELPQLKIIALPMGGDRAEVAKQAEEVLRGLAA